MTTTLPDAGSDEAPDPAADAEARTLLAMLLTALLLLSIAEQPKSKPRAVLLLGTATGIVLIGGLGLVLAVAGFFFPGGPAPGGLVVSLAAASLVALRRALSSRRMAAGLRETMSAKAARGLLGVATLLAGRRRRHLRAEWANHLLGVPEAGESLTPAEQLRAAAGFLIGAARMRRGDLARPSWRLIDWVLTTDSRVNTTITLVIGFLVIQVDLDHGFDGLLDKLPGIGVLGAGLYVCARWLRKRRGITVVPPKRPDSAE